MMDPKGVTSFNPRTPCGVRPLPYFWKTLVPLFQSTQDVYKRQASASGETAPEKSASPEGAAILLSMESIILFFCCGSVSYTHLDVYKRQGWWLPERSAPGWDPPLPTP